MNASEARIVKVARLWAPPPRLSLSEWADTYRRTSREASAVVGKWVTRPYQKEPLDAFTTPGVKTIVIMSAVQMLKTEAILNAIGYVIHLDPGPMLVLQYRDTDCEIFSKRRLAPMLRDTPILRGLVSDTKGRSSSNTITDKSFPGGHLRIAASGSPGNVAALPIRYLFCDEVDKYPPSAAAEGDPVTLAEGRLTEFEYNYKEILTCSPTVTGRSRIEKAFLESDQREFYVPCPKCEHRQVLKWAQVKFDSSQLTLKRRADSAVYVCEECRAEWNDVERWKAVDQGSYQASAAFNGIAGFRISSLASQKKTLAKIVSKFLRAQGDIERLKTFFNTEMAETWAEQGEAPEWERLLERTNHSYSVGTVPRGGLFLTCGVDVHPDRIEAEIVAWGRGAESWSIDYQILEGHTTPESLQAKLEGLLAEVFPHESGADMPIIRMFVDSGNQTADVYQAVRALPSSRVVAIKGIQRSTLPVGQPSPQDVTVGKKIKGGLKTKTVWVDFFKGQLYSDLKKRAPTKEEAEQGWIYPPGYCHFPAGKYYGDEHFKQLCAEQLVTRTDRKGRSRREWEQTRPRNEALDCRIYARAAAWDVGMDRFQERHWKQLEEKTQGPSTPPNVPPPPPPPRQESWFGNRTKGWLDR